MLRKLTSTEKKRRHRQYDARTRIWLDSNILGRWELVKKATDAPDNKTLLKKLLIYYIEHQYCVSDVRKASTPAHARPAPVQQLFPTGTDPLSDISDTSSSNRSKVSGVKQLNDRDPGASPHTPHTVSVDLGITTSKMTKPGTPSHGPVPITDEWYDYSSDEENESEFNDPMDMTWHPADHTHQIDDDEKLVDAQLEDSVLNGTYIVDDDMEECEVGDSADMTSSAKTPRSALCEEDAEKAAKQEKSVVYTECLLQISKMAPLTICTVKGCNGLYDIVPHKVGTAIKLTWKCPSGHIGRIWHSQPKMHQGMYAGDYAMAAAILVSGNNYAKVAFMCHIYKMGCVCKTNYYTIQNQYLCPTIDTFWQDKLHTVREGLVGKQLVVAGDGRMDSPGFCAKYCTYTFMDLESNSIVAMVMVDKREVDLKSPNMEKRAFIGAVAQIKDAGCTIQEVVTDGHMGIAKYLREEEPDIEHSKDMWHGMKIFNRKLMTIAATKEGSEVGPWRPDIINHIYWSCFNCGADEVYLRVLIGIIVHHIVDEHEWPIGACRHDEIINQTKKYLTPGSPAHVAVRGVVFDPKFQKELKFYKRCRSTANLESFHSHLLMYAGKRFAYFYQAYTARCQLAALDYQAHQDRPLKRNKTTGEIMHHRQWSKHGQRYTIVPIKVDKEYVYLDDLITAMFQRRFDDPAGMRRKRTMADNDPRLLSPVINPILPPSTAELVAAKQSRFG